MKKLIYLLVAIVLLAGTVAYADSLLPDDTQEFYNDCGYVCHVWPDGSGDCYPCLTCKECPLCPIDTPSPTSTPVETPVPTEEPTKEACNRGLGNGSEDCDPGNSGGKPGAAGEDNE